MLQNGYPFIFSIQHLLKVPTQEFSITGSCAKSPGSRWYSVTGPEHSKRLEVQGKRETAFEPFKIVSSWWKWISFHSTQ